MARSAWKMNGHKRHSQRCISVKSFPIVSLVVSRCNACLPDMLQTEDPVVKARAPPASLFVFWGLGLGAMRKGSSTLPDPDGSAKTLSAGDSVAAQGCLWRRTARHCLGRQQSKAQHAIAGAPSLSLRWGGSPQLARTAPAINACVLSSALGSARSPKSASPRSPRHRVVLFF